MAPGNESLAVIFHQCRQSFEAIIELVNARSNVGIFSKPTWEDEASRLRLWGANIGAVQSKANTSLDFRLRDAETVRQQIHKNLSNLNEALQEALDCVKEICSRDQSIIGDSTSISHSSPRNTFTRPSALLQVQAGEHEENGESEGSENYEEDLQYAFDDAVSLINSLFRMTLYIRNPSRRDQLKQRDTSAVANFETFDVSHIENKFPQADNSLTRRLGQANTVRRANLRYWERHHKKLAFDELADNGGDDKTTVAPLSESVATAFQPVDDDEAPDTRSHFSGTSYMSSLLGGETVRRPNLPEAGKNGAPFQCPICCYIVTVSNQREWMKHVFFDLQPYVCIFVSCKTPLLLYENRRDWFAHVIKNHLSNRDHFSPIPQIDCPLCHDSIRSLPLIRRHLARHLEEVALFSLPNSLFGEETEMVGDDKPSDESSDAQPVEVEIDSPTEGMLPRGLSDSPSAVGNLDDNGDETLYSHESLISFNVIYRPPRDDEIAVMRAFASHARSCTTCVNPGLIARDGGHLCFTGSARARDLSLYIFSHRGIPLARTEKNVGRELAAINFPPELEVARELADAIENGLDIRLRQRAQSSERPTSPMSRARPREVEYFGDPDSAESNYAAPIEIERKPYDAMLVERDFNVTTPTGFATEDRGRAHPTTPDFNSMPQAPDLPTKSIAAKERASVSKIDDEVVASTESTAARGEATKEDDVSERLVSGLERLASPRERDESEAKWEATRREQRDSLETANQLPRRTLADGNDRGATEPDDGDLDLEEIRPTLPPNRADNDAEENAESTDILKRGSGSRSDDSISARARIRGEDNAEGIGSLERSLKALDGRERYNFEMDERPTTQDMPRRQATERERELISKAEMPPHIHPRRSMESTHEPTGTAEVTAYDSDDSLPGEARTIMNRRLIEIQSPGRVNTQTPQIIIRERFGGELEEERSYIEELPRPRRREKTEIEEDFKDKAPTRLFSRRFRAGAQKDTRRRRRSSN